MDDVFDAGYLTHAAARAPARAPAHIQGSIAHQTPPGHAYAPGRVALSASGQGMPSETVARGLFYPTHPIPRIIRFAH